MTGHNLEVTSFDRKSPGSGYRRPKTGVYCTFHFLQSCSSQEESFTWQEITSRDPSWPEMNRKWRHFTGSHLEVAVICRKLEYTVHFTFYKAVARRSQSRDRKWCHVTSGDRKWRHLTGSHLEVAVEDRKLADTVHFNSFKAVARRRQSRDRKWCHVTSGDRKWRHWTGSHLEVAVEGWKLAYTVHSTFYKAVARRRQSRDRKWRHVTSSHGKWPWSDVIWLEVTWKWLENAENSRIWYLSLPSRL